MSLDSVKKSLRFLKRSGMETVGVLGGEPTLHPDFTHIIDKIIDSKMNLRLFTGGIISTRILEYLKNLPGDRIRIIINMAGTKACDPEKYDQIIASLTNLSDRAMIGYTITEPNQNLTHLSDLATKINTLPFIRMGIMLPRIEQKKDGLAPSKYGDLAASIIELALRCHHNGISLEFDCGFTRCMFTNNQLSQLKQSGCQPRFVCSPIIDIGCDLQTWSCFPLQEMVKYPLNDFANRDDLVNRYLQIQSAYRTFGVYDTCHQCNYKIKGQCAGGCLAQTIRGFKMADSVVPGEAHIE